MCVYKKSPMRCDEIGQEKQSSASGLLAYCDTWDSSDAPSSATGSK